MLVDLSRMVLKNGTGSEQLTLRYCMSWGDQLTRAWIRRLALE